MTESFPLKWPVGWDRTPSYSRKSAAFKITPGRARDELLHELKLLGAKDIVISSNVATYRRGGQDIMYADQSAAKEDPGVAVYFTWKNIQYAVACDKWKTVTDNIQALNKTIDAIRGVERWGTGGMMKAAFAGFKALPEETSAAKSAWETLGFISKPSSFSAVEANYKELAKKYHPDRPNGSHDAFVELQTAYQHAKKFFGMS